MATQADIAQELLRNKLLSTVNFLNYTGLTYKDIIDAINTRLSQDRNFDNFRESAFAQIMLEIFAGTTDLTNYLLERRAEESFFTTAKLSSSVIELARNLAYDIQRPTPAKTTLKVKLTGNITYAGNGFTEQDVLNGNIKIQIPQYTKFELNGKNFLLKNLFSYTLSASDIARGADYEKEIILNGNDSIELIQGELKYAKFSSVGNDQHNAIFQSYKVDDASFSNIYGDKDYTTGSVTKVGIGATAGDAFNDANIFTIDRRSLLTQELVNFYDFNSDVAESQKICLIRTASNGGVEIKFGDDKYVSKGLKGTVSSNNNIFVQYLSTLGSKANEVGVIGNSVNILDAVSNYGITLKFELLSNIIGGSDIEDNEAIKVNAPGIYYSLDRLITSQDYITYLESLTSPINVKNAIAWGEQEELENLRVFTNETDVESIKKLFNVVLFSCAGSFYNIEENNSYVKTDMTDVLLDSDYNEFQMPSQNYMTIYVNQNVVQQIKFQQQLETITSASQYITIAGQDIVEKYGLISNTNYSLFKYTIPNVTIGLYNYNRNTLVSTQVSAFSGSTQNYNTFDELAAAIQTSFQNLSLWDSVTVYFEDNRFKFKLLGTAENSISAIHDAGSPIYFNSNTNNILGLNEGDLVNSVFSDSGFSYSTKIDDVISLLKKRSQLTVKPVYISPIIQDFYLEGSVYIRQMSDRDKVQTQIDDKIYLWLDSNIDYNTEIYESEFVNLIKQIPDVLYTDIKLVPKVESLPYNQSAWLDIVSLSNKTHVRLNQLSDADKTIVYNAFNEYLTMFLNTYAVDVGSDYKTNTILKYALNYTVLSDITKWSNKINERLFYTNLVKNIVDYIDAYNVLTTTGLKFTTTANFYSLINDMHKDFLYIIRYNMIDSYGNVAKEYEEKVINGQIVSSYVGGGYSMGNEIIRVNINTNVIYK